MSNSTMDPTPRLVDGSSAAPATLLLAHGAGAPMDSPFMAAMASGLVECGWRVVRFEFTYMAKQRLAGRRFAPDRMPKLKQIFCEQAIKEAANGPIFIGGKSMGGRVASLIADELSANFCILGCICLGYPFHPLGKPQQLRTEHLAEQQTPTLILQGERDAMGRKDEVETYALSAKVSLEWIDAGDHSFKPTRSSGLTQADNWAVAVSHSNKFCEKLLSN
ncbi:MAG: alpha/beta family hydrolase [Prochlorococcus sp.]